MATVEASDPLVARGGTLASDAATAVAASPVILVYVTNYTVSNRILSEAPFQK